MLDKALASLPRTANENVLIGFDTSDDAGVYKLTENLALVQTVDFFTPIVDDPCTFGAIAAANALSDVYAMGGRPITALTILAYPANGEFDDLTQILLGGLKKMQEADCAVIGGHSIADDEIKFGYAVTGTVDPKRVKPNAGAKSGDALVFTKQIGTGVIATAHKRGLASGSNMQTAIDSMLTLNRAACEHMLQFDVHGCTDVSGFGLIGHAREMALASEVTLEIEVDRVRFLPGAIEYAGMGAIPGGLKNNRDFASSAVESGRDIPEEILSLLYDPQTSGGLLISLPEKDAARLTQTLEGSYRLGRVLPRSAKAIRLL